MGYFRTLLLCSILAVPPFASGPANAAGYPAVNADAAQPALEIVQTTTGNVFTGNGPNRSFEVETAADEVRWTVVDYWGSIVSNGVEPVEGKRAKLRIPIRDPGYYELALEATTGDQSASARTTFAVLSEAEREGLADFTFGMQTHFGQAGNGVKPYDRRLIPLLRYAGIQAIRDAQPWQALEVEKGTYDFSLDEGRFEKYMADLEKHQIDPVVQFGLFNRFYDNGATPYTEEGQQGYATFAGEVLRYYGEQVQQAGVYNEPNLRKFGDHGSGPADATPANYVGILRATSGELTTVRPDLTVAGPELAAGLGTQNSWLPWFTEFAELGGLEHVGAVSVHPYRVGAAPEGLGQQLNPIRQVMQDHGAGSLPLWITELGWPTKQPEEEKTQAEYLPRAYLTAISQGVERFNWYNFLDHASGPFGLLRTAESGLGAHTPKPAYPAYAALTERLSGARYEGPDQAPEGVRSERFESEAGAVRAIWSPGGDRTLELQASGPVRVTDAMGVHRVLEPIDGTVVLTVGPDVTYVQGTIEAIQLGGDYRFTAGDAAVSEDVSASMELDNTSGGRGTAVFEIDGERHRLQAPDGEVAQRTVSVPGTGELGQRRIFATVEVDGKPNGWVSTGLEVRSDLDVLVKPTVTDPSSGQSELGVQVTNNLSTERALSTLDWTVGDAAGQRDLDLALGSGETRTLTVPLPADVEFWRQYSYAVTVGGGGGAPAEASGTTSFNPVVRQALTIDGDVAELENRARIDMEQHGEVVRTPTGEPYEGPSDLSGSVWATADAENLYLAVSATDDAHRQTHTAQDMWQGDSVQFGLAAGVPGESAEYYEYTMARTSNGPQVYRHHAPAGESRGVTDDEVAVLRDDAGQVTTYELAIPWDDLGQIQPSDGWFSLTLLTNDDDGVDREGWIEWGSGVGQGKDPRLFNPMSLVNPGDSSR